MKTKERHHLKENELGKLARQARETVETRRSETTAIAVVVVVVAVLAFGYFGWRQHVQTKAHGLLAEAMAVQDARVGPPPAPGTPSAGLYFPTERERSQAALTKFKIAADAYPSTDAGIYARYQEAATSLALGTTPGAIAAYQQVIKESGDGFYGQMGRLGLAEAQARAGQYDTAINTFKELAQRKDGPLPVDGILMQLGRTYLEAGKRSDAQQTFNRLVEEYPESPFTGDARREIETLKKAPTT
ncbi:MAG TPA: tetratricopeptide repeat protein [Vicinamibacterales bacterium]|jgi:predicted negative regulator of RcsB-dependent stress response|nr:tetratricopeptide repeat protein [Vicinamibacterales bacterium]